MKKVIVLFSVAMCLAFVSVQAQDVKITKILGKVSTDGLKPYLNLETDTVRYPNSVKAFVSLQMLYRFEFTNGNTPMFKDDTIKVMGSISGTDFDNYAQECMHVLDDDIEPGESIFIDFTCGEDFENQTAAAQTMLSFSPAINSGIITPDSAYALPIVGRVVYASHYGELQGDYNTNPSRKEVTAHFFKNPSSEPSSVQESIMEKVRFYPNPVSSELNVANLKSMSVEIYNVVGQQIVKHENVSGDLSVDMREYPEGIYFVKLQNGKFVRTERIKLVR